jgi:hypothetical protein
MLHIHGPTRHSHTTHKCTDTLNATCCTFLGFFLQEPQQKPQQKPHDEDEEQEDEEPPAALPRPPVTPVEPPTPAPVKPSGKYTALSNLHCLLLGSIAVCCLAHSQNSEKLNS